MYIYKDFVVFLTKTWPKNIHFTVTAKCWREGCFAPPPPPPLHQ